MPAKKKKSSKAAKKKKAVSAGSPSGKKVKRPARKTVKKKAKSKVKKTTRVPVRSKATKSPPKGTLNDHDIELRKILIEKRRSILKEAATEISKFISGDTKQLVDNAIDDGDWSFIEMAEGVNLRKLTSQKDTLNKVDEALRKMSEGTYGICTECGDEISEERLKVLPFAIYCIECKEQKEREERFEMEAEL